MYLVCFCFLQGVDEEGEVIVLATEAPEAADDDMGDFTRQTQFLVGKLRPTRRNTNMCPTGQTTGRVP